MRWKEIEGSDGKYLISDDGKVFSCVKNKVLKTHINNKGYERIELPIRGCVRKYHIHRLVAEAFVENPNNYPIVNHRDENPRNNRYDNLEWCTQKYNCLYGSRMERITSKRKTPSGADNSQSKHVYQFDLYGNLIAEFGSCGEAARMTGSDYRSVSACCRGRLKHTNGFVFSYSSEFKYNPHTSVYDTLLDGPILQFDSDGNQVGRYTKQSELVEAGFKPISVHRVCRGERKTYQGYRFVREKDI